MFPNFDAESHIVSLASSAIVINLRFYARGKDKAELKLFCE